MALAISEITELSAPASAPARKAPPIGGGKVRDASYWRRTWDAEINEGVSLDDVLNPSFWAHVSPKVNIGDKIEVAAPDGSFFAVLWVAGKTATTLHVKPLMGWTPSEAEVATTDEAVKAASVRYDIKLRGKARWCVIDLATMRPVETGFGTREEAAAVAAALVARVDNRAA